jgi:N-acetylglucosamine kinase-like BadF-type ATPase
VIYTSTDEDRCIAAISGTGSIIVIKLEDRLLSLGGWGYKLNNGGGAYDIGRDGLIAALEYKCGFGRKTLIAKYAEEISLRLPMLCVKED